MANNNIDPNIGKDTQFRAGEEQAKTAQKGGIASGAARRAKREAREWAKIALDELIKDKKTGEEFATRFVMVKKQIQKAINNSDTKAFEKVLRVAGEWEQESNQQVVIVNNYNGVTSDAREALENIDEL